ncbi:DUF4383 domain-containing protein [Actinorugispora endophytica]|uniref:Uncharacterized protein DUF4383 n=1 Tax=Actinorugispora endophytica TaxID=1605990 RepID=A0A4V3D8L4_9ACTN|nr:DUF4383 domain-containing protein [Actinorugispora endophytica]TDQ52256.1 uncharacterized protein DUF4383 [Actinorugispora endophytica]
MAGNRSPMSSDVTRSPARIAAGAVGAVFLLVGILGFVPGITTGYDTMAFAGHHSEAKLLGLFQVSVLHNIVHLLFGVAGIAAAVANAATARLYLLVGGVVYLVLWLYGLVIDHDTAANFVPLNTADNWLHLLLGLGMIALWFIVRPGRGGRP